MLGERDFDRPFETMEPRTLLDWARQCGRQRLDQTSRFLATLPAIAAAGAFRKAGAMSIWHFAAKVGGITRREVNDLFRVHGRLGQYWVLWRLLALGKVRLWRLDLISLHVNAENASWWAERLLTCTRTQLKAYLAAIGRGKQPWRDGDSRATPIDPSQGVTLGADKPPESQQPGADGSRPPVVSERSGGQASLMSSDVRPAEDVADGGRERGELEFLAPSATANPLDRAEGEGEGRGEVATGFAGSPAGPVTLRIQISPLADRVLRELQSACTASEGPTSLGEVIERLILDAAEKGTLAGAPDTHVFPASSPTIGTDDGGHPAYGCTRNEPAALAGSVPEGRVSKPLPLPRKVVIECVYFNADTDRRWLPSRLGPIPVETLPPAAAAMFSPARSKTLLELHARAIVASRKHADRLAKRLDAKRKAGTKVDANEGRHMPVDIEVYLQARSGGFCERGGCNGTGAHLHHLDAFAISRRHNPDRMLLLCEACHDAFHSGLLVPDAADSRVLLPLSPGVREPGSFIDARVLAAKAAWRDRTAGSSLPGLQASGSG